MKDKVFSDMFEPILPPNPLQYISAGYKVRTAEEMDQLRQMEYTVEKEENWISSHRRFMPNLRMIIKENLYGKHKTEIDRFLKYGGEFPIEAGVII